MKSKCIRCGTCCKHILIPHYVKTINSDLKKWADSRNVKFQKLCNGLFAALIKHKCSHLKKDKNKKYKCNIYNTNKLSKMCKSRPQKIAMKLLPKCGYNLKEVV